MNMTKLIELYPNAQRKKHPASDEKILSLLIENEFLWIEKNSLSSQELNLLEALFPNTINTTTHVWYQFLFENKPISLDNSYRIIQLHVTPRTGFLKKEWQETIREMFFSLEDFFFYTETDALIIEKKQTGYLDVTELNGIFLSLDTDFDITTQAFIGTFHLPTQDLPDLFFEERKIFLQEKQHLGAYNRTTTLSEIALQHYTRETIEKSSLMHSYREILKQAEMEGIILELWRNLGNISSTAKALFLHRNTLKYKIEKFQEQTGFNLKEANDLLFCYLILLQN
ncbi:helix-turn-helix domain-containing protein [Enterococcus durans]|uniref:helix-turn-helix domain-containing protein n=1 Tax=Enterococcus durans TaxID=53345 RepID=UPI00189CFD02|nr:helix-turn-helix domain-containing protein [Enterococcus durans]